MVEETAPTFMKSTILFSPMSLSTAALDFDCEKEEPTSAWVSNPSSSSSTTQQVKTKRKGQAKLLFLSSHTNPRYILCAYKNYAHIPIKFGNGDEV